LLAERNASELLKELARATPQEASAKATAAHWGSRSGDVTLNNKSPFAQALADNGISKQTAHRYQALAAVPNEVMEAAMISMRAGFFSILSVRKKIQRVRLGFLALGTVGQSPKHATERPESLFAFLRKLLS